MRPLIVPFFISHRGCPHQCVFCNQAKIAGEADAFPTATEISEKIALYRASGDHNTVEVAYYGGTFTSLPSSVMVSLLHPLQPLIAEGTVDSVRISTRPDAVDAAVAGFLMGMGVRIVELGVQSMDEEVLARAGRGHTARDVEDACRILQDAGLKVGVQLMPGLPGDTPVRSVESLTRVVALKPSFIRIYPTLVIAGTELERIHARGAYTPLGLVEAVTLCKVLLHRAWLAGIPVIRLGLHPSEELRSNGSVIAGPCHAAFRQLVEGEMFFDLVNELVRGVPCGAHVTAWCAPARVSDVVGQRRVNLHRLQQKGVTVVAVKADPTLAPREVRVAAENFMRKGDCVHDLSYGDVQ